MKKFFMMLPLMVALVAMVGCKKETTTTPDSPDTPTPDVPTEDYKENDPYYTTFNVKGFGVFGSDPEMIAGTTKTVQVGSESFDVQLGYTQVMLWGNGVTFSEESSNFEGEGWLIDLPRVPLYFVTTPGEYQGAYLEPTNGFKVATTSTPTEGVCAPGTIDATTYGDWINYVMLEGSKPDSATVFGKTKGALFNYLEGQGSQEWMYLVYRGSINKMVANIGENDNVTTWGADINMANMTSNERMYGFHFTYGADSVPVLTKPYNYRSVNKVFNQNILNAPQAPARAPRAFQATLRRPYAALKK